MRRLNSFVQFDPLALDDVPDAPDRLARHHEALAQRRFFAGWNGKQQPARRLWVEQQLRMCLVEPLGQAYHTLAQQILAVANQPAGEDALARVVERARQQWRLTE